MAETKKVTFHLKYKKDKVTHEQKSVEAINKCTGVRYLLETGVYSDGTEFCVIKFDNVNTEKLKPLMDVLEKKNPSLPFNPLF